MYYSEKKLFLLSFFIGIIIFHFLDDVKTSETLISILLVLVIGELNDIHRTIRKL